MELIGMKTPCIIRHHKFPITFADSFMIRTIVSLDFLAGRQVIFAKRVPFSIGDRPGVVLLFRGSAVEMLTCGEGDCVWTRARTERGRMLAGTRYEIVAIREGVHGRIYVNGIDRTHPRFSSASGGNVNCDADAFIGIHVYDGQKHQKLYGDIEEIGLYNNAPYRSIKSVRLIQPEDRRMSLAAIGS